MNAELINLFTGEGFGIGVVFLSFLFLKSFLIKNCSFYCFCCILHRVFFLFTFFTAAMNICPAACFFFFPLWQYLWQELIAIVLEAHDSNVMSYFRHLICQEPSCFCEVLHVLGLTFISLIRTVRQIFNLF